MMRNRHPVVCQYLEHWLDEKQLLYKVQAKIKIYVGIIYGSLSVQIPALDTFRMHHLTPLCVKFPGRGLARTPSSLARLTPSIWELSVWGPVRKHGLIRERRRSIDGKYSRGGHDISELHPGLCDQQLLHAASAQQSKDRHSKGSTSIWVCPRSSGTAVLHGLRHILTR